MKTPAASPELNHPDVQTLRKVWELTPSVLVVTDPSGNIEYVNPAFERVTGYTAGEVLGKNPRILKSGTQGPEVYADLWRTITAGGTWTGRLQNRRKDGSLYWESLTIAPLCDGEGKILRYIAVKKDMTAEDELLLANEKRYAMTLEAVDDAVWDWNLTTGAAFFSPKYYSMLGYDVGEFPASYESWRSLVHPDDLARTEGELLRHIESGKGYGADIRMRSKSGEWIWISARGNIVEHDAQGKALRMMGTHTDISGRKRAEETLLKSYAEIRAMFETASVGMAQCDPQTGQWLRVNRKMCQITGYSPAEMLGMKVPDITHPEDRQKDAEGFRRVVMGEAPDYRMEKRYLRKDGTVIWVNVNMTVMRSADGKPVRTMAVIEDISGRKKIEDELRESERSLNEAQRIAQIGSYVTDIASGIWVASPTLYDIFGMDSSYVTNIENWGRLMAPGFEKEMVDYYYQVIKERGKFNKEYQVLRPRDGRTIWVSAQGEFTFAADGTPLFLKGTIQDITERKQAEKKIALVLDRLSLATKAGGVGIWDFDIPNNKLAWDDQMFALYGISKESFGGAYAAWTAGVHPEDAQRGDQEIQMAIRGEKDFDTEFRVVRPDGTIRYIRALAIVQRSHSGEPLRMTGTNWDITERRQAELSLQNETLRRHKLEQEVLAIAESEQRRIGHDLHDGICQELTGIQYIAEHVVMRLPEELPEKALLAKTAEDIRMVIVHARHLSHSLSPAVLEKSDLTTALAELAANTETTFQIACGFFCPMPPAISSPITATHLYRITQEAIQNAIRHGKATSIEITLRPSGAKWVLQVSDNGTPSETGKKSGRGLHIMRYRASMIGGSIKIRQISGTTMLCTFSL